MQGIVVKFDSEKGFGFIRVENESEDVFVHINDIANKTVLEPGQQVSFELGSSEKGKKAFHVQPGKKRKSPFAIFTILGTIIVIVAMIGGHKIKLSWGISYLCAINLATFLLYGYDKFVAGKGVLRIPEKVLHLFAFLGGTPFAFLAQNVFRHKTLKGSFRIVFWIIFIVQIVIIWQLWHILAK